MAAVINEMSYRSHKKDVYTHTRLSNSIDHICAILGFIILIPGFALYQIGIYLSLFSPFLGGYLGVAGLTTMIGMLPFMVASVASKRTVLNKNDYAFISFILIYGSVSAYLLPNISYFENAESKLSAAPQIISYYFIYRLIDIDRISAQFVIRASLAISGFTAYFLGLGVFDSSEYDIASSIYSYGDQYANYQFFGMIYAFSFLTFCPSVRSRMIRLTIYAISFYVLYVNGARSEFFIIIVSSVLIEVYLSKSRLSILSFISIISIFLFYNIGYLLSIGDGSGRIASLLIEGTTDASFLDRRYTIENALNTISENPIFGKYGDHELGFYAHNILSVWADYGILVFLLFVYCILLPIKNAILVFIRNERSNLCISMSLMAVSGVILFLFAKSYTHPIFGTMLALSARYGQISRRSEGRLREQSR